jgi:general secretion pathway protein A
MIAQRGIAVLTGDVGTGKTTLLNKALQFYAIRGVQTSVIRNPTLSPSEFLEAVLMGFGITPIPDTKTQQRLRSLEKFLIDSQRSGNVTTLVLDEAHALSPVLLEEVRLLGNIEKGDRKLLQILLLGQVELDVVLNRDDLRQFKQRIGLRFTIGPLADSEVELYIRHRWTCAGGVPPGPFTGGAVVQIIKNTKGLPRLINALCDNALLAAFAEQSTTVTEKHVSQAAVDLHLMAPIEEPAPAPVVAPPAPVKPPIATPAVQTAAPEPQTVFRSLERYRLQAESPSLLSRCAGWLGLATR